MWSNATLGASVLQSAAASTATGQNLKALCVGVSSTTQTLPAAGGSTAEGSALWLKCFRQGPRGGQESSYSDH